LLKSQKQLMMMVGMVMMVCVAPFLLPIVCEAAFLSKVCESVSSIANKLLLGFPNTKNLTGAVCLKGFYGKTGNRIITLANTLQFSTSTVQLDKKWSKWFLRLFNSTKTPNVHLAGVGHLRCAKTVEAKAMYHLSSRRGPNPALRFLHFSDWHMEKAKKSLKALALQDPQNRVVTVHSRWLEGTCITRLLRNETFCDPSFKGKDYLNVCSYTESGVQKILPASMVGASIILLGDGQQQMTERTFTIQNRDKYFTQLAMMVQSTYHVGNPASSVDYIIWHMRNKTSFGNQYPEQCFWGF